MGLFFPLSPKECKTVVYTPPTPWVYTPFTHPGYTSLPTHLGYTSLSTHLGYTCSPIHPGYTRSPIHPGYTDPPIPTMMYRPYHTHHGVPTLYPPGYTPYPTRTLPCCTHAVWDARVAQRRPWAQGERFTLGERRREASRPSKV